MRRFCLLLRNSLLILCLFGIGQPVAYAGSLSVAGQTLDCSTVDHWLTTHYTYLSSSDTANSFTEENNLVFQAASVPEALRIHKTTEDFHKGDLVMYFNRGDLCMSVSHDHGATWGTPQNVSFSGLRNGGGVVDPSALQIRNGKIRLFFYGPSSSGGDPALIAGDHVIYSAISTDGKNFTVQRKRRYAAANITDPEVIRLGDVWVLYTSQGQTTRIAQSADGKTFTDTGVTWNGGGIPGAIVHNSVVDILGCSGSAIVTARATDGIHFGTTSTVFTSSENACDPSPLKIRKSRYGLVYKKIVTAN